MTTPRNVFLSLVLFTVSMLAWEAAVRLLDDVRVALPRPRALDVMNTPAFGTHVRHIRHLFNVRGGIDV